MYLTWEETHTGNRLQTTQYHSGIILLPLPHNGLKNKHIELGVLKYREKNVRIFVCAYHCALLTLVVPQNDFGFIALF